MRSIDDILDMIGVKMYNTSRGGTNWTLCPDCSAGRKPHNRKKKCLGVTIHDDRIVYGCFNCDKKGAVYYDDSGSYGLLGKTTEAKCGGSIYDERPQRGTCDNSSIYGKPERNKLQGNKSIYQGHVDGQGHEENVLQRGLGGAGSIFDNN